MVKFREALHLDANGVLLLRDLAETLRAGGRHLILCEAKPETMAIFENAGLIETVGTANAIPWDPTNPTLALAKAVRRAKELAGGSRSRIVTAPHPELPAPASTASADWQI